MSLPLQGRRALDFVLKNQVRHLLDQTLTRPRLAVQLVSLHCAVRFIIAFTLESAGSHRQDAAL